MISRTRRNCHQWPSANRSNQEFRLNSSANDDRISSSKSSYGLCLSTSILKKPVLAENATCILPGDSVVLWRSAGRRDAGRGDDWIVKTVNRGGGYDDHNPTKYSAISLVRVVWTYCFFFLETRTVRATSQRTTARETRRNGNSQPLWPAPMISSVTWPSARPTLALWPAPEGQTAGLHPTQTESLAQPATPAD